jgi:hypothetical protein
MESQFQVFKQPVARYPRLDTILMVEGAIRKAKGDLTVREIWLGLPRKAMWQTYLAILDYLAYSGKIIIEDDKHVTWVWAPQLVDRLKKRGLVTR